MNIVVCMKQVPDTNEVKIDKEKGTLIRKGVPSIINPDDKHALEEALRIKEEKGAKVTVLSMGPMQAKEALREALAMGADEAILISDRAFAGADTLATAYALSCAIKKIDCDIVFAGLQAIDGDTAQVGPEIAENLNLPQITYVQKVEVKENKLKVERSLEDGYEELEVEIPCLLTAISALNEPRYMHMEKVFEAVKKEIKVWTADDIHADKSKLGLKGSPTKVKKTMTKQVKGKGEIFENSPKELAQIAFEKLHEKLII